MSSTISRRTAWLRPPIGTTAGRGSGILCAFTPRAISGCVLWLDASRITGLADGAAVAQWDDLSGNGFHATQGTAGNRPTYETNEINGRAVVRFVAASTQWLGADGVAPVLTGSDRPFTIVLAGRLTDTAANYTFASTGNSGTGVPFHDLGSTATQWRTRRRDDGGVLVSPAGGTPNTSPHVLALIFTGTTVSLFVDGVAAIGAAAMDVGATTLNRFVLGAWGSGGTQINPLGGDIAEVSLYTRSLSIGERRALDRFLSRKYAIAVAA